MIDEIETPVTRDLIGKQIPFCLFRHPGPIHSLEQAAKERGQTPEQVVRSIVFRISANQFVMVLMPGPNQVSWSDLRKYLGQSRLTMASEDEVYEVTHYRTGAVSPFGLPTPMRILVDESILEQTEISIGSGERGLTVIMKTDDLLRGLEHYEIGLYGKK